MQALLENTWYQSLNMKPIKLKALGNSKDSTKYNLDLTCYSQLKPVLTRRIISQMEFHISGIFVNEALKAAVKPEVS